MKRLRLFHFDIKTYGNYGDTLLFEAVRELFEGFAGGDAFEVVQSRQLRDPVTPRLVDFINENVDAVVIGACSSATRTRTSVPAGSGTSRSTCCAASRSRSSSSRSATTASSTRRTSRTRSAST
jgi:hypothetical protein